MFVRTQSQQSITIDRQRDVRRDVDSIAFKGPGI